jgi:putative membrane protein insertion efficiency factor
MLLALLNLYKRLLSPLLGSRCRFHPSCADYARIAVARFGASRGGLLAIWRLARCNPFSAGGIDEVPATFTLRRSPPDRCGRPEDLDEHPREPPI